MPVLKVKNENGVWQDIATANTHAHTMNDITDLPASIVDDVEALKDKVGADSVAYQITTAIQTNEYVHPYTHPADMITGLSDVAISGSYEDLKDVPEEYVHPETHPASMIEGLSTVATSGDYNDLTNKPELATVATSGSYNDLSNKPIIPSIAGLATINYVDEKFASVGGSGGMTEQVQADWDETDTTSPAYIKNKPVISGEGGASVQANWSQNDSTQADYIKNKPFGEYESSKELLPITTFSDFYLQQTVNMYMQQREATYTLTIGETYIVSWDGTEYECVAQDGSAMDGGDGSILLSNESTFAIVMTDDNYEVYFALTDTEAGGSHTVGVSQKGTLVEKIDKKFMPIPYFGEGEEVLTEIISVSDSTFAYSEEYGGYVAYGTPTQEQLSLWASDWSTANVIWDGAEYTCEPRNIEGLKCIGNIGLLTGTGNNGMPFIFIMADAATFVEDAYIIMSIMEDTTDTSLTFTHNVSVSVVMSDIITIDPKYIESVSWNRITEKPFYEIPTGTVVVDKTIINVPNAGTLLFIDTIGFIAGCTYAVEFNGVSYEVVAEDCGDDGIGFIYDTNECTFLFVDNYYSSGKTVFMSSVTGENTYKISIAEDYVTTIDPKFIPKIDGLPEVTTDDNGKTLLVSEGIWSVAEPVKGVPEVTTSDNDKVLTVVDGVWTAANITHPIELPTVSSSDNDKVLTVVDGVWNASTISHPVELPTVSSDDAGKFLRVGSDGTWIVETIQNVAEVGL